MKLSSFLSILCATGAIAETQLSGIIRDTAGLRIAGLEIHFYRRHATGFDHLTATTMANGAWSIHLPAGEWRAAALTDDILQRGYFCFPGFVWCGEAGEACSTDVWPPLWGGGFIDWRPVDTIGLIDLTLVPTRPELVIEKPRTANTGIKVSFETTTEPMRTTRQWRIEKSSDLLIWKKLQTVALSGASPVMVPDPESSQFPVCYYRAVQVEDVVPPAPRVR